MSHNERAAPRRACAEAGRGRTRATRTWRVASSCTASKELIATRARSSTCPSSHPTRPTMIVAEAKEKLFDLQREPCASQAVPARWCSLSLLASAGGTAPERPSLSATMSSVDNDSSGAPPASVSIVSCSSASLPALLVPLLPPASLADI